MFLLNRGSSLKVDKSLSLDGIVATASGLPKEQLLRQKTLPTSGTILFDPQQYFPINLKSKCKNTFDKLSTYNWFNSNPPEYDSTVINITTYRENIKNGHLYNNVSVPTTENDINSAIKACLDFQTQLNVSYYILPSPLVEDQNDCFTEQLKWINSGIKIASSYDKPVLISVAISENMLNNQPPEKNIVLQTILDNLMTYDNVDGFYLTISRNNNVQYLSDENLILSLLELCYMLGYKLNKEVFLNHIDSLGFLGLSVGATSLISGYTNKEKRLYFGDYIDKSSGGPALPHFYSFNFIGDFYSEKDMTKIYNSGLLPLMTSDVTTYSKSLFDALNQNIPIVQTPWRESKNNVSMAKLHRYCLIDKETKKINSLNQNDKINYVQKWLKNAESYSNLVVLNNLNLSQDLSHCKVWNKVYSNFISNHIF